MLLGQVFSLNHFPSKMRRLDLVLLILALVLINQCGPIPKTEEGREISDCHTIFVEVVRHKYLTGSWPRTLMETKNIQPYLHSLIKSGRVAVYIPEDDSIAESIVVYDNPASKDNVYFVKMTNDSTWKKTTRSKVKKLLEERMRIPNT